MLCSVTDLVVCNVRARNTVLSSVCVLARDRHSWGDPVACYHTVHSKVGLLVMHFLSLFS